MAGSSQTVTFDAPLSRVITQLASSGYAAICGPNNSGKSLILKHVKKQLGSTAYPAGPQRFYNLYHIGTSVRNAERFSQLETQFNNQFNDKTINHEQNYVDLGSLISDMNDAKRNALFDIVGDLLGNKFSIKREEEDNDLSMRYIDMDGQNVSVGSTGTRLLMTLIALCMDDRIGTLLIDEPELGLGPKVQSSIAAFFANRTQREKWFPHLNSIVVATHSHLFLDKRDIQSNFVIQKNGSLVSVNQLQSIAALHNLQFNLLGNSMEAMFLPAAIVLVEGKTDAPFIAKCIELDQPLKNILITECQGNVKQKLHSLKEAFGDLTKSPFRSRIFVVLDSVHEKSLPSKLVEMGMLQSNIVIWEKNGVEYLYPQEIMAEVFCCNRERVSELLIESDVIKLNGIEKKKYDLCLEVLKVFSDPNQMTNEIKSKLLIPLRTATN